MLQFSSKQMDKLSQASTLRSVETLEAFMAECAFGRFISDPPNTLRSLAVRAIQRAGSFGCPSVQDAYEFTICVK